MTQARIVHVTHFMPERIINNQELYQQIYSDSEQNTDQVANQEFFKGVEERRFASPDYLSEDLGIAVLKKLLTETNTSAEELDLIIVSCIFSDTFWPGIATRIQTGVGAHHCVILNIDTSCASFISGLNVARAFIAAGIYRKIAMITVTNFISRLPEFQKSSRSFVLGDGAAAALIEASENSNIIACYEESFGENYGLMRFEPDLIEGRFINYWERGCGPITVNFSREQIDKIRENAMNIVPYAVKKCLEQGHLTIDQIDLLITHQPNQMFLDEWRRLIGIVPGKVYDTLKKYGNLFQGSVAVTFADAVEKKIIKKGDLVALGTFSNGGDFASSIIIRWDS